MKTTNKIVVPSYKNKKGEEFLLESWKWIEPPEANYRMYFINSKHASWGERVFTVFVTKASFPDESTATHLANTLALKEVHGRLDQADESGIPLFFPIMNDVWCVL